MFSVTVPSSVRFTVPVTRRQRTGSLDGRGFGAGRSSMAMGGIVRARVAVPGHGRAATR